MKTEIFNDFRLVGGTSLSLQLGHRESVDIDLFTDVMHKAIDFQTIDEFLRNSFSYVSSPTKGLIGFGRSYILGENRNESIKMDLYTTETFFEEPIIIDSVRLAGTREIAAMKLDVVQRGGRKKDFWDLNELMNKLSIEQLLDLHKLKYPYNHDRELLIRNLTDFTRADIEPDPICLKGNYWELVKLDIIEAVDDFNSLK
jgi:hypothetical protein